MPGHGVNSTEWVEEDREGDENQDPSSDTWNKPPCSDESGGMVEIPESETNTEETPY